MDRYRRFGFSFLVTISIVSITSVSLVSCTNSNYVPPEPGEFRAPPTAITVAQLSSEYATNEATATAKYKGESLLFYEVEVEEASFQGFYRTRQVKYFRGYFTSGNVRFVLQDIPITKIIEPGFILNMEGKCLGPRSGLNNFITIDVYWVESIKGDIGLTAPVSAY